MTMHVTSLDEIGDIVHELAVDKIVAFDGMLLS